MKRSMLGVLAALAVGGCTAANAAGCVDIEVDAQRLACYDVQFPRKQEAEMAVSASGSSVLSKRWELEQKDKMGVFQFRFHYPIYFLLGNWSSSPNQNPYSPAQGKVAGASVSPLRAVEAKFQISLKTKIIENPFLNNGDIWFGYTQQSFWQLYNPAHSMPFRETNYAPEVFSTWRTPFSMGNVALRMINVGVIHQSNGQSDPLSRSWNRVYVQAGLESRGFTVLIRPWYRIREKADRDNNPDILNYIGRGEVSVAYSWDQNFVSLLGRHSLRGGADNRGSLQADWAFPVEGKLKGYVQLFTGYGESLIDYNHRQTTLGVGISLAE